ncbi:MAG: chain length determinant protein EpsF [Proteobacteria bacterium]|jgi:succinoglycan biosynthesis transport protein ExoP|nr:chain length determinant protein EpsF [Methylibium sp.]MBY0366164.1 chain length determinant protein EpsF [Burkholderiaceae bacterium]MCH8854900.1 chain length determinant protein EpsF [Pseudomonadota bacterium]|mmetsp:Transcript_50958/g.119472  ORF Transcript_50958/g.119472 Transcript_50958/m.119472 type:complete len:473 (+) Transcript_50958:4861-6279(+)
MNFGQFIAVLRARWLLATVIFTTTVALTVIVSLLLPKQYTAVASVVVDPKPDPLSSVLAGSLINPAFMATQVDVFQSDRVALRVVRNLKLAENPAIREQWQSETRGEGAIEVWLAELFQRNLDVKPSRESNVINVSYKGNDPRFAAAIANAFVAAYNETTLELKVDPARQYSSFFDLRAKEARDQLEQAQAKLSQFQAETGVIAVDERLDVENARLNELSSQYVGLQALASDSVSRQAAARGSGADRMQEVLNNPLIAGLKSDQARLEARLQELTAKLGDKNPQVIETRANLAELKTRIETETAKISSSLGISNNINQQRVAEIKAQLEAQRAKVLKMKTQRDQVAVLSRDVESAQRAYDTVLARLTQTSLESQTTQSYVSTLTQATPPLKPSSPKLLLNSILSVFVGALLALAATFALEFMDRRVRTLDDVEMALGLTVIGVMPATSDSPKARAKGASLLVSGSLASSAAN